MRVQRHRIGLAFAFAVAGAVLAVSAGWWAGARLRVESEALRVSQGPHLYLQGRNYPPPGLTLSRGQDRLEPAADAKAPDGSLNANPHTS